MQPDDLNEDRLLTVREIGKIYPPEARGLLRMSQTLSGRAPRGKPVLSCVDFDLRRGDALGIVGRNGSGKSTLLQIICGVLAPTTGTVQRHGRVAAMLELGAGFKPEFTGRENAALNAAIMGLSAIEISQRMTAIATFADIGEYFDRPVREYSSGMQARLAFAVCANVNADILVVDEVLGVGDGAFQTKCHRFIERFLENGAVLFVSHDEGLVQALCSSAIWLERGVVMAAGASADVLRRYRHATEGVEFGGTLRSAARGQPEPSLSAFDPRGAQNRVTVSPFLSSAPRHGNGRAVIDDVGFVDANGRRLETVRGGDRVTLVIRGRALADLSRPIAGFIFRDRSGQNLFGDNTFLTYRDHPVGIAAGERFEARLTFELPYLPYGSYSIAPSLIEGTQRTHVHLVWMEEAVVLTAHGSPITIGRIGIPMQVEAHTVASGSL